MDALHRTGFASLTTSRNIDDGLVLYDAYIVMAVRCAPPANAPLPEEITRCLDHLDAEVAELPRVEVVIALGKIAFDTWLRLLKRRGATVPSPRPQFSHGGMARIDSPDGLPRIVLGCYHPSRQNTNTGKLTPAMMTAVFRKAKGLLR